MDNIVFLNGKFIDKSEASISIMDRGSLFGDGVYELIPVYKSRIFLLLFTPLLGFATSNILLILAIFYGAYIYHLPTLLHQPELLFFLAEQSLIFLLRHMNNPAFFPVCKDLCH